MEGIESGNELPHSMALDLPAKLPYHMQFAGRNGNVRCIHVRPTYRIVEEICRGLGKGLWPEATVHKSCKNYGEDAEEEKRQVMNSARWKHRIAKNERRVDRESPFALLRCLKLRTKGRQSGDQIA
jgi:hypothetical protein